MGREATPKEERENRGKGGWKNFKNTPSSSCLDVKVWFACSQ